MAFVPVTWVEVRLQGRMSGRLRNVCENNENRLLSPKKLGCEEVGTGGRLDQVSGFDFSVCF